MKNNVFHKSIILGGLIIALAGFMGCDDFLQTTDSPKENVLEKETTATPSTVPPSSVPTTQTQITENEPTETIPQLKEPSEESSSKEEQSFPQTDKETSFEGTLTPNGNCLSVKDFTQPSSYKVEIINN